MQNEEKYYLEIKNKLIDLEVSKKVSQSYDNYNDLKTRYDIGKMLVDAQGGESRAKYGDGLIKRYSKRLVNEIGKNYSIRYLEMMRKFYLFQKTKPVVSNLTWSHYIILLSLKNENAINYYINQIIAHKLSKRELKVTKLKKEHIGQVEIYMNYIDNNIRSINQNKTIGVIICLEDNKPIIRYCSNPRIFSTTYKIESFV